jgi:hypothetical protein
MIYYVMGLHSKLSLLLLENKSSSLSSLFEDALEVEENIHASRKIQDQVDFKNMHLLKQTKCEYVSKLEQESNECEAVLEQKQAGKFISDCKSNSSTFT